MLSFLFELQFGKIFKHQDLFILILINYIDFFKDTDLILAFATLILAVATVLTLVVVYLQFKISRKESNAIHRPWIFREAEFETRKRLSPCVKIEKEYYRIEKKGSGHTSEKRIKIPFVNMGQTHASLITYYHMLHSEATLR